MMHSEKIYQSASVKCRCKKKGAPGYDDHQHIGISRGGRSTKIHAVVDVLGYPLVLELTGGQVYDGIMLQNCLEQLDISGITVLADKAYGSWENREYIANHDADFCIPPKSDSADPWYTDFYHYILFIWRLRCSGLHNFDCW